MRDAHLRLTFLILCFSMVTSSVDASVLLKVGLFGTSESSSDPTATVVAEETIDDFFNLIAMQGRASVQSLGVEIFAQGRASRSRTITIGATLEADVIFVSPPGITKAQIDWVADVEGTISGRTSPGGFSNGGSFRAQLNAGGLTGDVDGSVVIDPGDPPVTFNTKVSLAGEVPTNVPVSIFAQLSVGNFGGAPRGGDHIRSNFFDSLSFNPDSFFDIQTPGVTVNSVGSDWLVNNRTASANGSTGPTGVIPEPGTMAVWCGLGLSGLVAGAWRRRRQFKCA